VIRKNFASDDASSVRIIPGAPIFVAARLFTSMRASCPTL
jgi:hypothetical protein